MTRLLRDNLWIALLAFMALAAGAALVACGSSSSSTTLDDDVTPTDDDASPADDDAADDDDNDDHTPADDDDDNDDDGSPADCPPITQQQATRFYWPNEPPTLLNEVIGETVQGVQVVAAAGILGEHTNPVSVDEIQWTIMNSNTVKPGQFDLTVPEGGTIKDGNPNMYISVLYGAQLNQSYSEWWISVSGCAEIDELGGIGGKFTGHLKNVVFRKLLSSTTGQIDWSSPPQMGFSAKWDLVNQTIIGAK